MKAAALIVFFSAFTILSIAVKNEVRWGESHSGVLQIGQAMPDFILPDRTGQNVTFSQVVNGHKLIIVNFWASWCAPCRLEMPSFEKMYKTKSKDGLLILAINEDEQPEALETYLKEKPVSFPVLLDRDGALMKRLGGRAFPTTILVGGDGKVGEVVEGVQEYLPFVVDGYLKGRNGQP